jgi:glutaredoxin
MTIYNFICVLLLLRWTSAFVIPSETRRLRPLLLASSNDNPSATTLVIRKVLDELRDSKFIQEKHLEHCQSPAVTHLFKGTPLAKLPDSYKLKFVSSWLGLALATVMAEEQVHLGDWKMEKILEAAGDDYDPMNTRQKINGQLSVSIVMYSFIDCPWCVAAKTLLEEEYPLVETKIVELESLGQEGKAIRAELARWTGRTSMPCIFVHGQPIGGFTDGVPCGPGLQALHESGNLATMLKSS